MRERRKGPARREHAAHRAGPASFAHFSLGALFSVGALFSLGAGAGCGTEGEGQIQGTFFLRGCEAQDPTPHGSTEVPAPLPAFALDPGYFYADVLRSPHTAAHHEGESLDRLHVRLQRGSEKPERTDVFELMVPDMNRALRDQELAIARGERGFPILPAPVAGSTAPLPGDPYAFARASLSLHSSCTRQIVQPQFRGYIRIIEAGRVIGEWVEGEVGLTIEDSRAIREQGGMPTYVDTAGALSGRFRVKLAAGPAYEGP